MYNIRNGADTVVHNMKNISYAFHSMYLTTEAVRPTAELPFPLV